jgi:hypothetical protein
MTPERVDALVGFLESLSAPVAAPPGLLRPPARVARCDDQPTTR